MEVSNERSSESELQLRSVREQIYPKEGSREADFLFVDSEVVGEIDENRDADEDADISTRSATSGWFCCLICPMQGFQNIQYFTRSYSGLSIPEPNTPSYTQIVLIKMILIRKIH